MTRISLRDRSIRQRLLARLSDRFRHHVEACIDLRDTTADPLHAAYLAPESDFVLNVPGHACRGLHAAAYPLTIEGEHPFVATVRAIAEGQTDFAGSPLDRFYIAFQPRTAAEVLGLPPEDAHPDLRGDPFSATLPWDYRSPEQALDFWTMICARDYRQHGFDLDFHDGWKGWGPVTEAAGRAEFLRLNRAYHSITTNGYLRHSADDGDIQGVILRHGEDTRILVTAGQHRAAVLAALGHPVLPIRLSPALVSRDDVPHWPNVRRGIFSRGAALRVFDRIFAGRQPWHRQGDADAQAPVIRAMAARS